MNLVGNQTFAVDVALIFDEHFRCFDDFFLAVGYLVEHGLEWWNKFGYAFDGDLRTDNQINQLASVRKGSRTKLNQCIVYQSRLNREFLGVFDNTVYCFTLTA